MPRSVGVIENKTSDKLLEVSLSVYGNVILFNKM